MVIFDGPFFRQVEEGGMDIPGSEMRFGIDQSHFGAVLEGDSVNRSHRHKANLYAMSNLVKAYSLVTWYQF